MLERKYYNADNLNKFVEELEKNDLDKIYSVEFNRLNKMLGDLFSEYFDEKNNEGEIKNALNLLNKLRNNEIHFFIDTDFFLLDEEYRRLHNFMILFYDILHRYNLLPFWGEPTGREFSRLKVRKEILSDFTYRGALAKSKFVKSLKRKIEGEMFPGNYGSSAYDISESIAVVLSDEYDNNFDELYTYVQMLMKYKILSYDSVSEEYEFEDNGNLISDFNMYRYYYIEI